MPDLTTSLFWGAVQATINLAAALVGRRVAARSGAGLSAFVATFGLGLAFGCTLLALAPRTAWWCWPALVGRAVDDFADTEIGSLDLPRSGPSDRVEPGSLARKPGERGRGASASLAWLRRLAARFQRAASAQAPPRGGWSVWAVPIVLAGIAVSLARVMLGLWAVGQCRRRSVPLGDRAVRETVETLRAAMDCRRPIELRESPDLATAATLGWRRPIVLLSAEWRGWSQPELRAVLAHEVAHVAEGHYLAGLIAQLCVAFHFYHPLAHALAAWLRLDQELAADALGARFGGGATHYLRTLSRMALRQDDRPAWGPARSFLPGRETLIRRIAMLRKQDDGAVLTARRPRRAVFVVPLVAIALAASGLRRADRPAYAGPPDAAVRRASTAPALPRPAAATEQFDRLYLPPDAHGIVVVRPAAALRLPGMSRHDLTLKRIFGDSLPSRFYQATRIRLDEIEQIAFGVSVQRIAPPKGKASPTHRFASSGLMIRSTHEFDWKTELERVLGLFGKATIDELEHQGQRYYRVTGVPALGPKGSEGGFYLPDDRTLVIYPRKMLIPLMENGGRVLPDFVADVERKTWESNLVTVALDNRGNRYGPDEPETVRDYGPLFASSQRWVLSVSGEEMLKVRLVSSAGSMAEATKLGQEVRHAARMLRQAIDQEPVEDRGKSAILDQAGRQLARNVVFDVYKNDVAVRAGTNVSVADLLDAMLDSDRSK